MTSDKTKAVQDDMAIGKRRFLMLGNLLTDFLAESDVIWSCLSLSPIFVLRILFY